MRLDKTITFSYKMTDLNVQVVVSSVLNAFSNEQYTTGGSDVTQMAGFVVEFFQFRHAVDALEEVLRHVVQLAGKGVVHGGIPKILQSNGFV